MRNITVFTVLLLLMILKVHAQTTSITKADASMESKGIAVWDASWNQYPTYNEYVAKMKYFAATYPNICRLQSIGKTPLGRDLWVIKISDNATLDEAEPEFLYSSTMHGDELTGYPLMIRLIAYLLSKYESDSEVNHLVNTTEIYINPLANPDGTYRHFDNNTPITSPIRGNNNGVDLNRNYPDYIAGLHHDNALYQTETKAFMAFEASRDFVLSANFHAGTEVVNYPNDNTAVKHADHDYYEHISNEYALNAQKNSPKDYYKDVIGRTVDFKTYPDYMSVEYDACSNPLSPGVTQGSIWYQVFGSRQDYVNFYRHSKEITIELSFEKFLDPKELPHLWKFNKQAFLDLIKQANYGFQGTVTDHSGNPIVAKISIADHDTLNSYVYSNTEHGDYYRLIKGGTYTVTFEAPGYEPQTLDITVKDQQKTIRNVSMEAMIAPPITHDVTVPYNEIATLHTSGHGTLHWYKTLSDTIPLFKGDTFYTDKVIAPTSYYVEDIVNIPNVGPKQSTTKGVFLSKKAEQPYLEFDCVTSVHLKTVTINTQHTGELEVQLQDRFGTILDSQIFVLESEGIQTLALDFIIPVGKKLRLVCSQQSSQVKLFSNLSANATNYPYTNGYISITGNHSHNLDHYYVFYDWNITPFKSLREEIKVEIDNDGTPVISNPFHSAQLISNTFNEIDYNH